MDVDGCRIHYVDAGQGPTVVFIHGSPVSSYSFRHQIEALKARFRVVAPDLPGFGRSSSPKEGVAFKGQSEILRRFLDGLDPGQIRLVLHDWGGPIGLGCACARLEQVTQLVLINTTCLPDFRPPPYWRAFIAPRLGDLLLVRLNLFGIGLPLLLSAARSPEVRRVYAQPFRNIGTRRTVLALERLEGYRILMESVMGRLPDLQVPTLVLWGHPDPYFRPTELERLKASFKDVAVQEIPEAGHFPQEDAPEAVTEALMRFLR